MTERDPGDAGFDVQVLKTASNGVRRLHEYWDRSRGERPMPRRSDFDPADLPRLLPGMILVDVEGVRPDGTGLYRYRVVGGSEVAARRHNPTGRLVDEGYYAESLESALAAYDFVRIKRRPLYDPVDFVDRAGRRVRESSILLPFSENGEDVSQILVFSERLQL